MSGALAVGLLQLPPRVDAAFNAWIPRLGDGAGLSLLLGYQYVKLILYTLILTLFIHIVLRAFWVSLIGLDSVFPRGVRWDRVRLGPISRAYLRRRLPSVRELIVRTDGIASVLFAGAFYISAIFVLSVVLVIVGVVPLFALGQVFGVSAPPSAILMALAVGMAVMLTIPAVIDRRFGARVDPDGWTARWIRATQGVNLRFFGLSIYGPSQYTLSSQLGGRRAGIAMVSLLVLITGTFVFRDVLLTRERIQYAPLSFVPLVPGQAGVDPRYYEDQWPEAPNPNPVPSLRSDVVDAETPYLRLFVPFRPRTDNDAVARLCPGLAPLGPIGLRRGRPERGVQSDTAAIAIAASLACASRLWDVRLDGMPVREEAVFATHPTSRLPGLAWYVDVRGESPGRHLLTIVRSAEAYSIDIEGDDGDPSPPRRHEIPFWR